MKQQYSAFVPDYTGQLIIDWAPGNLCNFSCKYCHPSNFNGSEPWHSSQDSIRFLDYVYETICKPNEQAINITVHGGEPSLWPSLDTVCKHLKKIDNRNTVRLLTNGTRNAQWWTARSDLIDNIIVSIHHGQTKKEDIVKKFNAVELSGIDVSMHVMIDVHHFDECIELYNYIYDNCEHIQMQAKVVRIDITQAELQNYSEEQLQTIKRLRRKNCSRWGRSNKINAPMHWVDDNNNKSPVVRLNEVIMNKHNDWEDWFCSIGTETLVITKEGRYKAGSQCFRDIWYGNIQDIKYNIPPYPTKCKYQGCFCLADVQTTKTKDIPIGTKYIDHDLSTNTYKIATRN
jgi:organic radical activating enzyme